MGRRRRGGRVDATGRTAGEQFFAVPYRMAKSIAWRSLSGPALKVWVELRTRYNGKNNGDLSLSFEDAARLLSLSKSTVGRAYAELEQKGFIQKTKQGQWYGRMATTWTVTDRAHQGHQATNDWRYWRPPDEKAKSRSRYPCGTVRGGDGPVSVPSN
ncbi:helix-turn-helix domain-containing protein [Oceanibacterium hippocampi]|uniref:Uncharacterized protein n=1 Tax=Oceanibacterium hippocampi TaxID=745714 RepID=A0A1Y5RIZ4_9PROT|nr:helix-turn-helix domain-containing protein [Oceanibacterium hippocampi]SLN18707.1 hypothetical protein OCH7691_00407 [Oceanibacterium hippocampi]